MKNKSKKLVVVLVILILLAMAVAYAAVSQTLTITGTARVAADVSNVIITGIEKTTASTGATDTKPAEFTNTTATFDVTLAEPGDYALYTVTVKNNGNTDAKLSDIAYYLGTSVGTETTLADINDADPAGIKFEVTTPTEASTLAMDATAEVTVKAYWDEAITNVAAGSSKSMTMTLLYEVPTP